MRTDGESKRTMGIQESERSDESSQSGNQQLQEATLRAEVVLESLQASTEVEDSAPGATKQELASQLQKEQLRQGGLVKRFALSAPGCVPGA